MLDGMYFNVLDMEWVAGLVVPFIEDEVFWTVK